MKSLILTEKIHNKLIEMEVILSLLKGEKSRFLDNEKVGKDIEKISAGSNEIGVLFQSLTEVENEREVLLQRRYETVDESTFSNDDIEVDADQIMTGYSVDQQENEKENKLHSLQADLKVEKEKYEREKLYLTSQIEEFQVKLNDYEVCTFYILNFLFLLI